MENTKNESESSSKVTRKVDTFFNKKTTDEDDCIFMKDSSMNDDIIMNTSLNEIITVNSNQENQQQQSTNDNKKPIMVTQILEKKVIDIIANTDEQPQKSILANLNTNNEQTGNTLTSVSTTKRNVAVKKTASQVFTKQIANPPKRSLNSSHRVINRINNLNDDQDDNILQYDDSSDDYIPKNNSSDEDSEKELASSSARSKRLIKKPKILDDYHVSTNSDNINSNVSIIKSIQTKESSEPIKITQSSSATNLTQQPKHFARKSTAPLNPINNQISLTTSTTTTTSINTCASLLNNGAKTSTILADSTTLTNKNNQNSTKSFVNNSTTPKQYRHKIVSCKPFYQSKATECYPIMKDASTQINLDEIKPINNLIPLPVPINVPIPMCMYQAPMPIPILVPVPIPVPIFIPTTKKSYDRIERKIKKLRQKLPSDPYEFEILLYAEKLAREEGIAGFEESSDGESEPETEKKSTYKEPTETSLTINELQSNQSEGTFKWTYGVKAFDPWLKNKLENLKSISQDQTTSSRIPDDLLKLRTDELNMFMVEFVNEIRKQNGEAYAPESIYYLCLGIQYYLQEKGRCENIFLDSQFEHFQEALNQIALRYQIRINAEGLIVSRIEEEILWESKQLGAHSPFVLLNTILYFNTKYFFLDKPESHLQLSFTNVKKHSKRNIGPNGEDYGKTVFLRYYPDFNGLEQLIYEQGENYENPVRCPVELYNFYLSKCPENVKNRNDVFYLLPEKASQPSSPVWFSSQPIGIKMLEKMLNRIKMVKEVNELLLAASPSTNSTTTNTTTSTI